MVEDSSARKWPAGTQWSSMKSLGMAISTAAVPDGEPIVHSTAVAAEDLIMYESEVIL